MVWGKLIHMLPMTHITYVITKQRYTRFFCHGPFPRKHNKEGRKGGNGGKRGNEKGDYPENGRWREERDGGGAETAKPTDGRRHKEGGGRQHWRRPATPSERPLGAPAAQTAATHRCDDDTRTRVAGTRGVCVHRGQCLIFTTRGDRRWARALRPP